MTESLDIQEPKLSVQDRIDRAFVLILQGDWHGAYVELGHVTSYTFTGEWRPPTVTMHYEGIDG